MTVTRGRALWEVLRQMPTDCMTWEGTFGSGAKIGMTRRRPTASCAVRRGAVAVTAPAPRFCLLRFASATPLKLVALTSGFVVLWRLSLRREAGYLHWCRESLLRLQPITFHGDLLGVRVLARLDLMGRMAWGPEPGHNGIEPSHRRPQFGGFLFIIDHDNFASRQF
jgi:hypothetical protein